MKYIDDGHIQKIRINWEKTVSVIEETVNALEEKDYSQPIKPYLRYGDKCNRIIAMPAYVGKKVDTAGIKWIASFPENIEKGIPRANCAVILNNSQTGQVEAVFNAALISTIRTASVTGLMIRYYLRAFPKKEVKGWNYRMGTNWAASL